jgi:hypothetical protein
MRALDRHKPKARPAPRWKAPKVYRFRLSSTFWRAVASAFPANTATTCNLTLDEIEAAIERSRAVLKKGHFSVPNANSLHAVFSVLGADRLAALISRHMSLSNRGHFGTPDLFLFAVKKTTGTPCMPRFVEVKKPGEKISM